MIKFFRTIRQSLVSANKFNKYLLYAIGEIILVVIGILIALQINNWNESRINDIKEKKILYELLKEFEINQRKFEFQIQRLNENIESHHTFIEAMTLGKLNNRLIDAFHQGRLLTVGTMNPTLGTVNTILFTGDIALIQNDSIRNAISNWSNILDDYVENEKFHLNYYFNQVHPYIRENFLLPMNSAFPDTSVEEINEINLRSVNKKRYRNHIIDNLNWSKTLKGIAENTLNSLIILKTQIEQELEQL